MKKNILILTFFLISSAVFSQVSKNSQIIYGRLDLDDAQSPAANVKVFLAEVIMSGVLISKNFCTQNPKYFDSRIQCVYSDFKGNYSFVVPKAKRYQLLICTGKYVLRVSIPPSMNNYVNIPSQQL
jgi:hypothetical protein